MSAPDFAATLGAHDLNERPTYSSNMSGIGMGPLVVRCFSPACDWSTTDIHHMYDEHRAHVADVLRAVVAEWLNSDETSRRHYDHRGDRDGRCIDIAALGAVRETLG